MNMKMKMKILSLGILGIAFLSFARMAQATTRLYSATDFQSTSCPTGSDARPLNLTTRGDLVRLIGVGFGDRNLDDSIPEMVYVPTTDGVLRVDRSRGSIDGVNDTPYGLLSWSDTEIQLEVTPGLGSGLGSYVTLRKYSSGSDNQGICTRGALATYVPPPPTCTSFTYSEWGACTNGQQTRTALSSSPEGCTDGEPVLTQSCAPSCAANDYSCTEWSACSVNGQQTRTCTKAPTCEGGVSAPATSQNCTYTAPVCTSWTYSNWSACSSDGQQARTVVTSSPEGCAGGTPVVAQNCTPTLTCSADTWSCGDWSTCTTDGTQSKSCSITSDCPDVQTPSPATTQSCTYNGPRITGISPNTIYPGTSVTITGTKLANLGSYEWSCDKCKAFVNDKEVAGIYAWSWHEDRVTFTMPADAQSGYVEVVDSKGTRSNRLAIAISQDPATIPPSITSINPRTITPGGIITITGSNFGLTKGSSQLVIGGGSASGKIVSWNDSEIQYQTSAWDTSSKRVGIKKCKDYYSCLNEVSGGYFYIQPQITSLDVSTGREGMKVTIRGKYLKNENVSSDSSKQFFVNAYFNGTSAYFPKDGLWTSDALEVIIPESATSGPVSIEISADGTTDKVAATGPAFKILEKISNDQLSDLQLYLKQINLPQAWGFASNRRKVTVAIIDDGVYNNHPDLKNKMWRNSDEIIGNGVDDDRNGYIDDRYGWNYLRNTSDVTPEGSHGTQVAGIIAAEANNGIGIAGVNWNVEVMPLIVCNDSGCQDYSRAIRYAVDNGAEVINLSLASRAVSGYTTANNDAIEYAYQNNVLIVTAGGNGDVVGGIGFDLDQIPQSPACNNNQRGDKVIGVGAVDQNGQRTRWSNYGSCIDIYAPGVAVLSTSVPAFNEAGTLYDPASGTSFAAPIITGIVSLLKATYPTITSQEAINLLINNANGGVVDAYKTLAANFVPANTQPVQRPTTIPVPTVPVTASPIPTAPAPVIPNPNPSRPTNDATGESFYRPLVASDATAFSVPITPYQTDVVTRFIVYGNFESSKQLGAGERRALVRDYFETVGRVEIVWEDVERLANGQKVVNRNLTKERAQAPDALKRFKRIFGHAPIFSNPKEDLAWNTLMYRIRFPRNIDREKDGITKFKVLFSYAPSSPLDWATVRALGYVVLGDSGIATQKTPFSNETATSEKWIRPTVATLNIRSDPRADAAVIDYAKNVWTYKVTSEQPGWLRIQWWNSERGEYRQGWVMRQFTRYV